MGLQTPQPASPSGKEKEPEEGRKEPPESTVARKKNARKEYELLAEVNQRLSLLEKVIEEIEDRAIAEELDGLARLVRTYKRSKNYGKCLKFLDQADKHLIDLGMKSKVTKRPAQEQPLPESREVKGAAEKR